MSVDALSGGFADPVTEAQAVFRAVLDVLSRPGTIAALVPGVRPPPPLNAGAAAVLASLADQDTPVYLDAALAAEPAVATWIGFHTGAPVIDDPEAVTFAVIADPAAMPALSQFRLGTDEYPDRSTTIVMQVADFAGSALILEGPGIDETAHLAPHPSPANFAEQFRANRGLYPRGVDLIFATGDSLAALPRSTRIRQGAA
ncbi:phosphonate C-P lyase system protein PhnH [Bauldia litoralis]|uniref:Alpha-D-ribose 1-methylphosphonate 5-triphosphate synthase subunit PhnH n=1 Tax=Bauldia litoralis TaxID=665467 RepID=A0A1G6BSJ8_9HYPH|nr:phosphonate C-P lyase system protein PhnH [Bauldia litoralis]SDB23601.1 alpha-D-ribose 1-methylphosphonate 5-triphosphate synthase subunit PhnH [Bauldia litoralis]